MTRTHRNDRYTLLCLAIRALARRGVPLVIISKAGGFDFELEGRPVGERDVLVRASMLDMTLLAELHGTQFDGMKRAA